MQLIDFTCPTNPELQGMGGVANGYVAIPPTHPFYECNYDLVQYHFDIDVHQGLTYADFSGGLYKPSKLIPYDWWVFGFDTMHGCDFTGMMPDILTGKIDRFEPFLKGKYGDRWQKIEEVELEAKKLKWQLEELDTNLIWLKMAWVKLTSPRPDLAAWEAESKFRQIARESRPF